MLRSLPIALLLAAPFVRCADSVEVSPSGIEGVLIEAPGAVGFHDQFVARMAQFGNKPDLVKLEPFFVRVTNRTRRPISHLVLRYDVSGVVWTSVMHFPAGMTFDPGVSQVMTIAQPNPSFTKPLSAASRVIASVDAVIFDNGEFVGRTRVGTLHRRNTTTNPSDHQ